VRSEERKAKRWNGSKHFDNSGIRQTNRTLAIVSDKDFNVYNEKRQIRKNVLHARLCLSDYQLSLRSERVLYNLFDLPIYKSAKKIALYISIKNEVKTERIFEDSRESGKKLYLPRVEGSILRFYEVKDPTKLKSGKYGIPEPNKEYPSISTENLDLVIIPGVAFDHSGKRIGYGKGFYDRSIKKICREKRIGLAYSFQILNKIPFTKQDTDLGYVITDLGIISCGMGKGGV